MIHLGEGDKLPIGAAFVTVKAFSSRLATNQFVEFVETRKTLAGAKTDSVFAVCETLENPHGGLFFNDSSMVVHSIVAENNKEPVEVAADITLASLEMKERKRVHLNDTVRIGSTDFKILSIHTKEDIKSTFGWLTIERVER